MSHKTAATVAHTIRIDTGKNTLHLIGLDDKGQSFCGRRCPRPDRGPARQLPRCAGVENEEMASTPSHP